MKTKYTDDFYEAISADSNISANKILPLLFETLNPKTIVDFGCGTGSWLNVAKELGCIDVLGIDGDYINREMLCIDESNFIPFDLSNEISLNRRFDMAMSLEVAEHLHEEYADTFIDNLCRHSQIVLFSAAIKDQGGTDHFNEQPLSYWVEKFQKRGYTLIDFIRPKVWEDKDIATSYKQNMVLFIDSSLSDIIDDLANNSEKIVDIVHPELFQAIASPYENRLISRRYLSSNHPKVFKILSRGKMIVHKLTNGDKV